MEIKILHRWSNTCLWSSEVEDAGSAEKNTGAAVLAAIRSGADLTGASLRYADLTGASLRFADLTGANLTRANLRRADLTGADLTDADLTDANLRYANLRFASLTGANLRYANLTDASLTDANLTDADLTGADLTDANLPEGYRIARLDFGGWPVTVTPEHTTIGCQRHENSKWLAWEPEDEEIRQMASGAREWWTRHREAVRAVIRDVRGDAGE